MVRRAVAVLCTLGLAAAAGTLASARQTPADAARTAPLASALPLDPTIVAGRFDNGLRYLIRVNREPAARAELRLVVDVGSLVEDDDQLGLAHFVEHMAFNGTANFPKQDIVAFMESIGMRFGPSVNAFTSFDETVYMLQVPTDRPGVLDRAMLVLADWAHRVSFDPEEIDKERGVVIEEWRFRRGAGARLRDRQFPVLLKGSRYADRLPIGTVASLEAFRQERLKQFYADWYRPDLMTVIAVGDFDGAAVERLFRTHFASIPAHPKPRARPVFPVPEQPGTLYAIATDPEAPGASVSVYSKMALRDPASVGAYRQQLVERLFVSMLSSRLDELARKPDPPFMAAGAGRGLFVRSAEASILNAAVKDDGIARGLEALFLEAERVVRHGFTASELERAKTGVLRSFERQVVEREKRTSASLADEYVRHATEREPVPGIEYEDALARRFVPAVTLAEVNALAREWVPDGNRVVLVSAPEKSGLAVPDEARLAAAIRAASAATVEPYVDTTASAVLLATPPAPGRVVDERRLDAFGITEWRLSNGIRVVLKPTTFKQDEVVFRAFGPGGTSLAADADFIPADSAIALISASGLDQWSSVELRKMLTGKVASVRPVIGETEEGLSGSASPKDLETMFQLLYLTVTAPRADPTIFDIFTGQMKAIIPNQRAQPAFAFAETLTTTLRQNHPRARPPTLEMIDQMSLEKSLAFYRERFADVGDFTFVFVGTFDPAALRPFVERYVASLPGAGRKDAWRDVGLRYVRGVVEKRVEKGIEPQSQTAIVFTGPFAYNQTERVAIRAMSDVLQTRLREVLREELGGTYGVGVAAGYTKVPLAEYRLTIDFGSAPDRADALAARVFEEIAKLKAEGPTERQVSDVREAMLRDFETNSRLNGWLLTQVYLKYQLGEEAEIGAIFGGLRDYYTRLSPAAIQQAARTYLDTGNYVKVVLVPER